MNAYGIDVFRWAYCCNDDLCPPYSKIDYVKPQRIPRLRVHGTPLYESVKFQVMTFKAFNCWINWSWLPSVTFNYLSVVINARIRYRSLDLLALYHHAHAVEVDIPHEAIQRVVTSEDHSLLVHSLIIIIIISSDLCVPQPAFFTSTRQVTHYTHTGRNRADNGSSFVTRLTRDPLTHEAM